MIHKLETTLKPSVSTLVPSPGRLSDSSEHTIRGKQLCLQSMLFCSTRMHCSYRVIILGK